MSVATNDIACDEDIGDARPCLCKGIQHPKLTDPKNEAFCRSNVKLACLNGRWHSSQCHFIVDDKGEKEKNRCSKCKSAHGNIRRDRNPELFQTAESNNNKAEIINLQRLRNLLLGELTLETLKQMDKLEKEAFSKKNYEQALLQEPSPTNSATANNDAASAV